jgi:hypothetical protein
MSKGKRLEQVTTFVSGLRSHAQVRMEEPEQMSDPNVPHVEMAAVGMTADCGARSAAEAQPATEAQPSAEVRNTRLRRSARGQAGAIPEGEHYAAIIEESIRVTKAKELQRSAEEDDDMTTGVRHSIAMLRELDLERSMMRGRLRRKGLTEHEVPEDGDCQFHAVSHQLSIQGICDVSTADFRSRAVAWLEGAEGSTLAAQVEGASEEDWSNYCAEMALDGETWGSQLTLMAVCVVFQVRITVVSARANYNNEGIMVIECPSEWIHDLEEYHKNELTIGHYHERHHNSTIVIDQEEAQEEVGVAERVQEQIDRIRYDSKKMSDLMLLGVILDQSDEGQRGTDEDVMRQICYCADSFKGHEAQRVFDFLDRHSSAPQEGDDAPPSRAMVFNALMMKSDQTRVTKGINCHALAVATAIIFSYNNPQAEVELAVSCDHMWARVEGITLNGKRDTTTCFEAQTQYVVRIRQAALPLIPAMAAGEIREELVGVLSAYRDSLDPWTKLDLARSLEYDFHKETITQLYRSAVGMTLGYPACLGAELAYYEATPVECCAEPHFMLRESEQHRSLMIKGSTAHLIQRIRVKLDGEGKTELTAKIDAELRELNVQESIIQVGIGEQRACANREHDTGAVAAIAWRPEWHSWRDDTLYFDIDAPRRRHGPDVLMAAGGTAENGARPVTGISVGPRVQEPFGLQGN